MKRIGKKMMLWGRAFSHQSEDVIRKRWASMKLKRYREKHSKMMEWTHGEKKKLTRKWIDEEKERRKGIGLYRCSYDLEKGEHTRESPWMHFEFQFFLSAARIDAENWADRKNPLSIVKPAADIFDEIMDKNKVGEGIRDWLTGQIHLCDRRYAVAKKEDVNFVRVDDDHGTGVRRKYDYY